MTTATMTDTVNALRGNLKGLGIEMVPAPKPHADEITIRQAVLAGNSIFTLVSKRTGERVTYKVTKGDGDKELWFVGLLSGPDNENHYRYVGIISNGVFRLTGKSLSPTALGSRAFRWFWDHADDTDLADSVEFVPSGRCVRCGRRLTVPASVSRLLGPECATRV